MTTYLRSSAFSFLLTASIAALGACGSDPVAPVTGESSDDGLKGSATTRDNGHACGALHEACCAESCDAVGLVCIDHSCEMQAAVPSH